MTKQEAIQSMREGNKVTHRYFGNEEWITMEGNRIITEEGYSIWKDEFFKYRDDITWETDWEVIQ